MHSFLFDDEASAAFALALLQNVDFFRPTTFISSLVEIRRAVPIARFLPSLHD